MQISYELCSSCCIRLVPEKFPFVRAEVTLDAARLTFVDDPLKLERLDDFTDPAEVISTYTDGPVAPRRNFNGWTQLRYYLEG